MSSLRYEKKSGPLPERISTVVPKSDATEGKLTYFKVSFFENFVACFPLLISSLFFFEVCSNA